LLAHLPQTRVVSIPTPHLLLQTQPAAATMAISQFLSLLLTTNDQ
jgi:hypothetical protein